MADQLFRSRQPVLDLAGITDQALVRAVKASSRFGSSSRTLEAGAEPSDQHLP